MIESLSNTPPDIALILGLSIGALLADTIERIMKLKLRQASGVSDSKKQSRRLKN